MLSAHAPTAERANPLSGGLAALRVKGDKAFALFYGPHNQQYMMPMVSEGGPGRSTRSPRSPTPSEPPAASP